MICGHEWDPHVLQEPPAQPLQPLVLVMERPPLEALNKDNFRLIWIPWQWTQLRSASASLMLRITSNSVWQSWH